MAVWDRDVETHHPLDYRLARHSSVALFHSLALMQEATGWLRAHGYRLAELDAASWATQDDLHADVAMALDFPDHYGRNLDALNDCLSDVASGDYGWDPHSDTGLVVAVAHLDAFAAHDPHATHALLNLFADQARSALLIGHRLLLLAHANDPQFQFGPVGATDVTWGDALFPPP